MEEDVINLTCYQPSLLSGINGFVPSLKALGKSLGSEQAILSSFVLQLALLPALSADPPQLAVPR